MVYDEAGSFAPFVAATTTSPSSLIKGWGVSLGAQK